MREIKFRAWDLDNEFMYYQEKEEENGEGMIIWEIQKNGIVFLELAIIDTCPGGKGHHQELKYIAPKQVLMQFTGQKDKNGQDIYEGDILNFPQRQKTLHAYVYWENLIYKLKTIPEERFLDLTHLHNTIQFDEVEIIGNIYE